MAKYKQCSGNRIFLRTSQSLLRWPAFDNNARYSGDASGYPWTICAPFLVSPSGRGFVRLFTPAQTQTLGPCPTTMTFNRAWPSTPIPNTFANAEARRTPKRVGPVLSRFLQPAEFHHQERGLKMCSSSQSALFYNEHSNVSVPYPWTIVICITKWNSRYIPIRSNSARRTNKTELDQRNVIYHSESFISMYEPPVGPRRRRPFRVEPYLGERISSRLRATSDRNQPPRALSADRC